MKKTIALILLLLTVISFSACSDGKDDNSKLQGDEKEAFAAVEKYYKATGELDIRTGMEALFPEALEKQLENYGGSIDKYAETVEKYMAGKEKIEVAVEFKSIDRNKYSSSALERESEALAGVYGIDPSGVEKIVNISFDLIYTEKGEEHTDSESCDVCRYNGKWYISPERKDQTEEPAEAEPEEVSYPEALEAAVNYVCGQVKKGRGVEIINAPSDTGILEQDGEYTFFAIVDNDFYETTGGFPYQSLEIHGVSDNNYVVFTGGFSLAEDGRLVVTVTAQTNDGTVLGSDSKTIGVTVGEKSLKKGNAVKFKMR